MNKLLPPNQTKLESGFASAVTDITIPNGLDQLWSPSKCPVKFLPWLAWSLSIDAWSPDWSDAVKRKQIKAAPEVHRRKGTARAVKDVVAAFGGAIIIREWFETTPRGDPGTFALYMSMPQSGSAPTSEFLKTITNSIDAVKPASAHYTFTLAASYAANIKIGAIGRVINFTRINAVLKPNGGADLVYLTDPEGHFLIDDEGNLLIDNT